MMMEATLLRIDATLPPGALVGQPRSALRSPLAEGRAIWLAGTSDSFTSEDGIITGWRSCTSDHCALPTRPNTGNGRLAEPAGLQCRHETHCGLVIEQATDNAGVFSVAVVYTPAPEAPARTLVTINTTDAQTAKDTGNYLFVADDSAMIVVQDDRGSVQARAASTAQPGRRHLLMVTLSGAQIALSQNLGNVTGARGADPGLNAAASLFIGCRSHRGGIRKTLGGATIHDVIFWPGHSLLLPRSDADRQMLAQFETCSLWET